MRGFVLVIPLLLVRYGLLYLLGRGALKRAAHYAPMEGNAQIASFLYQLSTIFLVVFPCFTRINTALPLFAVGLGVYLPGLALLVLSTIHFANPPGAGFCEKGLYRFSRNPMYVAYFLYFLGCALLARSLVLGFALVVFTVSSHWVVVAEERWCIQTWGDAYRQYMARVRRYL